MFIFCFVSFRFVLVWMFVCLCLCLYNNNSQVLSEHQNILNVAVMFTHCSRCGVSRVAVFFLHHESKGAYLHIYGVSGKLIYQN